MSQTLSLQPGKYALFITPPVAGVDYTGTPLPTVSYQWKKNGAAIAGQTSATISGVWVEQSGGTVDLVDGDVISIDIILTNPVSVATKTISATIDSAIPAPVILPVSIRQLSGGTYQTVTNLANTDIGEQVIVASNTGGTVTTTPPVLATYQWRRGFAPIAGATSQTYTLQAADADSIIDCVVTATNSGGTATTVASVSVGTVASTGWTDFTQYLTTGSRIMYVSSDGDNASGRSYAPSEVGSNPMNPAGPVLAFKTYEAARSLMRDYEADWILFRRGDSFVLENGLFAHGANLFFTHDPNGSPIRKVIGAYGSEGLPRPILTVAPTASKQSVIQSFAVGTTQYGNTAFVSLDMRAPGVVDGSHKCIAVLGQSNLHFEDCHIRGGCDFTEYQWQDEPEPRRCHNITLRRCAIVDAARAAGGHVQGLFVSQVVGLVLEECVLDRNGYAQDPTNPSTWSAPLKTDNTNSNAMPVGQGVQPHRTWFSRNFYGSSYSGLFIRGCILSRSGSSHQMRVGGVAERNVFIWNDSAMSSIVQSQRAPWLSGQTLSANLVLHDDHLLCQSESGVGLVASVGQGFKAVVSDNIVAHFCRTAEAAIRCNGIRSYSTAPAEIGDQATLIDNVGYLDSGTAMVLRGTTGTWWNGFASYVGSGNAMAFGSEGIGVATTELSSPASWTFGSNSFSGSMFRTGLPSGVQTHTFGDWQARGFDVGSTSFASTMELATQLGWQTSIDGQGRRGWERDIVSYMQSVDPSYSPDENVTVDDGVPAPNRRPDAPKVWEVLAGLHAASNSGTMTEPQAKLTARRYHACLQFIDRARQNRKGAWDVRYTADAINNYMRAGFGKSTVSGGYNATLPQNEG